MLFQKKIVIAGGTGFIGQYLEDKFRREGYEVLIISRNANHISWNNNHALKDTLENAEVLINLAGKSVDCRYTKKNKAIILSSRIDTTRKLQDIAEQCAKPPALWINASTATIYRHSEDKVMTEENGEIGTGFSVEIAKAWEAAFFEKNLRTTRKIALRIAITLGKNGGVMRPYINLVKFGLGGQQGNGKQMFSWIHLEDLYRIIRFIMIEKDLVGVFNAAAPKPIQNKVFMKTMRKYLNSRIYFSIPNILLKIGAIFIRTETELVLKSRWVVSEKLEKSGFKFLYPVLDDALNEILSTSQNPDLLKHKAPYAK